MLVLHVHYNRTYFHFCEWTKDKNLEISSCMGLYAGMLVNCFLIFSILDRKNSMKSSDSSSYVLLGGIGFCAVLPVSLLTSWKSSVVSFLKSRNFLLILF